MRIDDAIAFLKNGYIECTECTRPAVSDPVQGEGRWAVRSGIERVVIRHHRINALVEVEDAVRSRRAGHADHNVRSAAGIVGMGHTMSVAEFMQHYCEGIATLLQGLLAGKVPAAAQDIEYADTLGIAISRILREEIGPVFRRFSFEQTERRFVGVFGNPVFVSQDILIFAERRHDLIDFVIVPVDGHHGATVVTGLIEVLVGIAEVDVDYPVFIRSDILGIDPIEGIERIQICKGSLLCRDRIPAGLPAVSHHIDVVGATFLREEAGPRTDIVGEVDVIIGRDHIAIGIVNGDDRVQFARWHIQIAGVVICTACQLEAVDLTCLGFERVCVDLAEAGYRTRPRIDEAIGNAIGRDGDRAIEGIGHFVSRGLLNDVDSIAAGSSLTGIGKACHPYGVLARILGGEGQQGIDACAAIIVRINKDAFIVQQRQERIGKRVVARSVQADHVGLACDNIDGDEVDLSFDGDVSIGGTDYFSCDGIGATRGGGRSGSDRRSRASFRKIGEQVRTRLALMLMRSPFEGMKMLAQIIVFIEQVRRRHGW